MEGLLFVFELVAMLLLLWSVFKEGRSGGTADQGIFSYRENLTKNNPPKGSSPHA